MHLGVSARWYVWKELETCEEVSLHSTCHARQKNIKLEIVGYSVTADHLRTHTGPDFECHSCLLIFLSDRMLCGDCDGIAAITEVHDDGCNPLNYLEPDRQAKAPIRPPGSKSMPVIGLFPSLSHALTLPH